MGTNKLKNMGTNTNKSLKNMGIKKIWVQIEIEKKIGIN